MKTIIILCLSVLFFIGSACNNQRKQKITAIVKAWQGKQIIFPDSLTIKVQGKDTLCPELFKPRYKIVNYIDTSGCTDCKTRFYEWNLFQKQTDSLNLEVSFIFIAWQEEYEDLETLQYLNHCRIPCIYDTIGQIAKINQFPTSPGLQTFLLDSLNQVIVIGNPTLNEKIRKLYLKRLQE